MISLCDLILTSLMVSHVEHLFMHILAICMGFPAGSDGKESSCNVGDLGLIPGSGRSPGGENGNPLQYSCLENPHGQRSPAGYSPWGCKESDVTAQHSTAHMSFLKKMSIQIFYLFSNWIICVLLLSYRSSIYI